MKQETKNYFLTINGNIYNGLPRQTFYQVLKIPRNHRPNTVISHHVSEYGTYVCVFGLNDPKTKRAIRYISRSMNEEDA